MFFPPLMCLYPNPVGVEQNQQKFNLRNIGISAFFLEYALVVDKPYSTL